MTPPSFDPHLRDANINAFADIIETLMADPQLEDGQIREAYTYLEILFAIVVSTGNATLKLARIRTWRNATMARVGEILGVPEEWEPLFVDSFNRLEFAIEPESIHRLVYISQATQKVEQTDLNSILEKSHRNNRQRNVTGLLLYGNVHGKATFLQILEGRKQEVNALYKKIKADPRHSNCETVFVEDSQERSFPGWSMGYRRLDPEMADQFAEGFSSILEDPKGFESKSLQLSAKIHDLIATFKTLPH